MKTIKFFLSCLIIAGIFFLNSGYGQENQNETKSDSLEYSWNKFSFLVGGFFTGLNNDIHIGSEELGLGVSVNLEDALGLQTSSFVFRSEFEYIFGKRQKSGLKLVYFGFFRNATKILESELEIGEEVFPIGTEVESTFDLQILSAQYNYSYFIDKRVKLGASFGFFVMPIDFSTTALNSTATGTEFVAPLPVFGLNGRFAVTPKLFIDQSIKLLYLQVGDFTGSINDINFRVDYFPWEKVGFGLGYNSNQLNIKAKSDNNPLGFAGRIRSGYTGIMFYAKVAF